LPTKICEDFKKKKLKNVDNHGRKLYE
jgi:hypothetical protein